MLRFRRSIVPAVAAAALGLAAAGCGSDSPGASQGAATPSPSATVSVPASSSASAGTTGVGTATAGSSSVAPVAAAKTITVRVAGGKATPKTGRVEVAKREKVRLVVTSDVADEVHVHTYDLELRLRPGKPGTLTFTADKTGLFEVETHETGLVLFQLLVR